jgi:putative spermidine/putrescine transport system permease protein
MFFYGFVRLFGVSVGLGPTGRGFDLTGYGDFATSETNRLILVRTLRVSAITTLAAIVVAYPIAYAVARVSSPGLRYTLLVLSLSPWLISLVISTYGWSVLMSPHGTINSVLLDLGIIDAPLDILYNSFSVIVGMVHVFVPFLIMSIYSSLARRDWRLLEAASVLGSGPVGRFFKVTLPMTARGVLSGATIVFLLATGAVVTPVLLGGLKDRMLATLIYQDVIGNSNTERAAVATFCLILITLPVVALLGWIERRVGPKAGR